MSNDPVMSTRQRQDMAIAAAADALLAICAVQTGFEPMAAYDRATVAVASVLHEAEQESRQRWSTRLDDELEGM